MVAFNVTVVHVEQSRPVADRIVEASRALAESLGPHDSSKSPDERLEAGSVERIQPGLKNTSGKENGLVVSDLLVVREK